ncbi:hypothetical protein LIER_37441 [Lithospermum erythrorhizon]|uniref:Uncharacterized protein n=1 Tax=Lithospermum erythrorhizon TaxID=34254 RepID=A0AAV3PKI1_LITER
MADHLALSVGNVNQVPLNRKSVPLPTKPHVQNDITGTSQPPYPPIIPPTDELPMGDIRDEVQTRVHIGREQEIQRQVDQILPRIGLSARTEIELLKKLLTQRRHMCRANLIQLMTLHTNL